MSVPLVRSMQSALDPLASPEEAESQKNRSSYGQILKSTALVGGSSALNVLIGIFRVKALAMFLGPAGFGIAGLYLSVSSVIQTIGGMGVNSSGVRQIAAAVGANDATRIARSVNAVRLLSVVLGILAAGFLVLFSGQISELTFGTRDHTRALSLLAFAVFFTLVSTGQTAIAQGLRQIAVLAKNSVLGSLATAVITIVLVYFYREAAIIPSLIGGAAAALAISWGLTRKLSSVSIPVTLPEFTQDSADLLRLGVAFMASSMLMMLTAYVIRILIRNRLGIEATGLYQSAWTLGGLYIGFVLQAMGADFYPRLTAEAGNREACTRLVNEQTRVALLLSGPGVLATLSLAPLVITLFYSPAFVQAIDLLRWISLGAGLRAVTWPMGFIIMAKGRQDLMIVCDLAWAIVGTGLAYTLLPIFGLNGAGIAFASSYVFNGCLVYPLVRKLYGFRWSVENKRTGVLFGCLAGLVFWMCSKFPPPYSTIGGLLITLCVTAGTVKSILALVPSSRLPGSIQHLCTRLGLLPAKTLPAG